MKTIHHPPHTTQPSRYYSTILASFGANFFGKIELDGFRAQLAIRPLTNCAGEEFLRVSLFAFRRSFRALLRPTPKTESWHSDFSGLLIVGTRRYHVGATFLRNGLLKIFLRPLHLHAAAPARLEVVL